MKRVYVAQTHEYVEPTSGYTKAVHTSGAMMDSDRANEEGYTGKGTVTAVLDTGLDINHAAFANAPESPRYTEAMDCMQMLQQVNYIRVKRYRLHMITQIKIRMFLIHRDMVPMYPDLSVLTAMHLPVWRLIHRL